MQQDDLGMNAARQPVSLLKDVLGGIRELDRNKNFANGKMVDRRGFYPLFHRRHKICAASSGTAAPSKCGIARAV